MIIFDGIDDDNSTLVHSPMVRAVEKIFVWIDERGAIPSAPRKAFKRSFVNWAVEEFDRPGYSETELFATHKTPSEMDFPPPSATRH